MHNCKEKNRKESIDNMDGIIEEDDEKIQISKKEYDKFKKEYDKFKKENDKFKKENDKFKKENKRLKDLLKQCKNGDMIYFRDLVKIRTDHEILKATPEQLHKTQEYAIKARELMKEKYNSKFPINSKGKAKRVNECGNYMEKIMDEISSDIVNPLTDKNKKQDTGYPDREVKDEFYLEIKVVDSDNIGSTFRSFYISTFNKINKSMPHILIAFKHKDCILTDDPPMVRDLYDIKLKLKCEYQTNNKELYFIPKKPEYTIEELNEIHGGNFNVKKREKNKKYSVLCKIYGLKSGGKCEDRYQRLITYLEEYSN